jgi:hypothetical protein
MEYPFNFFVYCFIYFLIHFLTYRLFNINISKILTIIIIFIVSVFLFLRTNSPDLIFALINFNLFVICLYILMPGIINNGPALMILDIIIKNKLHSKKKIKLLFMSKAFSSIIKNRLKINIKNNFTIKKNNKIFLSNKGKFTLNFFSFVIKIFKLKTYE